MSKDKKILYSISAVLLTALLVSLFLPIRNSKIFAACLLASFGVAIWFLIKKRQSVSINKREVLLLSVIIGSIYVLLIQFSAAIFGLYKNPYFINFSVFMTEIIPMIAIIVSTEVIRYVLLSQKNGIVSVLAFFSCVFAECLAYSGFAGLTSFNQFMDVVGLVLFPAISANIYYNYISKRYGMLPNIAFRLITTLYIYFIPNTVDLPDALNAFIKLFVPIVMLMFVSALYEKKEKKVLRQKNNKLSFVAMLMAFVFMGTVVMLVSCEFRFGALVIATESMTGEINKGDVIIYEKYDDQTIKEGQVIVFTNSDNKIIHRVVKIENIGGETRYYTKGDANADLDYGYRTEDDIFALTDMKISYAGYPSLWLRGLLDRQ